MDLKLWVSFLKDQILDSIMYFGACFLIGLFYFLSVGKRIEVVYPLAIALFVYLLWMLIRFIEYYKIYRGLDSMVKYQDYQGSYRLEINKRMCEVLLKQHMDYMDRLSEAELARKRERRFLSLWIHNMKTPVTVTDLLLQRMENKDITGEVGIPSLKEENKKLLVNLDHVLNIIRLEDFAKDYVPEQLDLIEELKAIINKNKSLFIYSRVFPKIETDLEQAVILSDKKWNELMINQLISNGVKYSKDGQGNSKDIFFILRREADRITLTIRDEGIGIPEYDLGKVFEPFFTGDNGRKGYQSSGIGLYFCREVCKLLGHTLELSSEAGKGTSVKITYLAKL